MNEINECPFCRGGAELTIEVETDCVNATIGCPDCDVIFKFAVTLSKYKTINEAVDDVLTMALEQWNTESQERKESNIEWAIKKGLFAIDACRLANRTMFGMAYVGGYNGYEFKDNEDAVNYLLAPHED